MDSNAFGKLVREYRQQRGWTQEVLADRWGFTRIYISQIERGKRKLDKLEQVYRLADILGIPEERLAAVGKGFPLRKTHKQTSVEGEDLLLKALLEPAETTIKLSWLIWQGNGKIINIESSLHNLAEQLEVALDSYRGQFRVPALRLLAYTHEMLGKQAIERIRTKEAIFHFQQMYDIAEETGDPDLVALAIVHQSEMFRRRKWFEAALRRMAVAENYLKDHEVSPHIQGVLWRASAINHYVYRDEQGFLRAIDRASEIAENIKPTVDTVGNDFDRVEVLQVKAIGLTTLGKPEQAIEIYKETDKLRPFRPLRDQSSYHIIKAQSYCLAGDTQTGIKHAKEGMKLAEIIHSIRYIIRLQQMFDLVGATPLAKQRDMIDLRGEILGTLQHMQD
ncbi:MAG: helix-turn-helix domain-containing protein [Ktedonobacteraceae bacterium]|nr:helix-turn-helix domain-containing protein [Ktedonobacteraceae bacterium]